MPTLRNPRHERFCQEFAAGKTADEAYRLARYRPSRFNAARLKSNENIAARIAEIISAAADNTGITIERTLRELGKIGFADIRSVATWRRRVVEGGVDEESGLERPVVHDLVLVDSDNLPNDVAAAIAEVSQSRGGTIRVKMHNKQAALESILRQLERGKGTDLVVEEKTENLPAWGRIIDPQEAWKRFGRHSSPANRDAA